MKNIFIVLIFLALAACANNKKEETTTAAAKDKIPVRTAQVLVRQIDEKISVQGTAAPLWSVDIFPDGAGKIIEKYFNVGDRVNKGDILAKIIQDIPGMDFSPSNIDATVGGVVTASMVELGSAASPQRPVFTISQLDSIMIKAHVLESQFRYIKVGSACSITAEAAPSAVLHGRVAQIEPILDSRTHTAVARITLPNPGLRLLPGMSVTCKFSAERRKALMAPLDAVTRAGMQYNIVKIIDGRARIVAVQAGKIVGRDIEISGDVKAGDRIVVYGQNLLQDGSELEIVD